MPEYLSPGVYIEEVATGPVPIAGVGTSAEARGTGAAVSRGDTSTTSQVSPAFFRTACSKKVAARPRRQRIA